MRYAVDITRNVFFADQRVSVADVTTNVAIIVVEFVAFMVIGTAGFVRAERNR